MKQKYFIQIKSRGEMEDESEISDIEISDIKPSVELDVSSEVLKETLKIKNELENMKDLNSQEKHILDWIKYSIYSENRYYINYDNCRIVINKHFLKNPKENREISKFEKTLIKFQMNLEILTRYKSWDMDENQKKYHTTCYGDRGDEKEQNVWATEYLKNKKEKKIESGEKKTLGFFSTADNIENRNQSAENPNSGYEVEYIPYQGLKT